MAGQQDKTKSAKKEGTKQFAFHKQNYILLIAGLVILGLGFLLMIGGGSDDPDVFSYALFDFQRLTLAPILLLIGYIVEIVAILYRPGTKQ